MYSYSALKRHQIVHTELNSVTVWSVAAVNIKEESTSSGRRHGICGAFHFNQCSFATQLAEFLISIPPDSGYSLGPAVISPPWLAPHCCWLISGPNSSHPLVTLCCELYSQPQHWPPVVIVTTLSNPLKSKLNRFVIYQ